MQIASSKKSGTPAALPGPGIGGHTGLYPVCPGETQPCLLGDLGSPTPSLGLTTDSLNGEDTMGILALEFSALMIFKIPLSSGSAKFISQTF